MSGIIGQIDGALADWTTSKDAMRWTPEPDTAPRLPGCSSWIAHESGVVLRCRVDDCRGDHENGGE